MADPKRFSSNPCISFTGQVLCHAKLVMRSAEPDCDFWLDPDPGSMNTDSKR